jgi:hypothetical protein
LPIQATSSIPLGKLIHAIQMAGFSVSVEQVLEMQRAFLSTSFHDTSVNELKFIITPIVAKDATSQQKLHGIIDSFVERATEKKLNRNKPRARPPKADISPLNLFLSVFGGIVLLLILVQIVVPKKKDRYARVEIPSTLAPNRDSFVPTPFPIRNADTGAATKQANRPPIQMGLGFKVISQDDIQLIEQPHNINKQLCVIFGIIIGIILSFVIFSVKQKETEQTGKRKSGLDDKDEVQLNNDINPAEPARIDFPTNNLFIHDSKHLLAIKNILGRQGIGSLQVMDVQKSIISTIKQAGFYSPAFTFQKQSRHYLVLVDEEYYDGHMTSLFNYLVDHLQEATINLSRYRYHKNILELKDEKGNTHSLSKLASTMPTHQLLIFGNSRKIFTQDDILMNSQLMSIFTTWESKSIITAVSMADWSQQEMQLQASQFSIVPAEMATVELLARSITTGQPITHESLLRKVENPYSVDAADVESVDGLWIYMDDEHLFQWLCSLAVYPALDWNITLALYNAIIKQQNVRMLGTDYDNLLKLCRISWMQGNKMDDKLRLNLLLYIDPSTETIARQTLLTMLQEAVLSSLNNNSLTKWEAEEQMLINSFLLYAHDRKKFNKYLPAKKRVINNWERIKDSTIKQLIGSVKSKMMPINKTTGQHLTIEEFKIKEEEREVRRISFLRCLTILIPPAIIYVLLIVFRPGFAYPAGTEKDQMQQIKLVIKKDACLTNVDSIAVLHLTQKLGQPTDTIYLPNIKFNDLVTVGYTFKGNERLVQVDGKHALHIIQLIECK